MPLFAIPVIIVLVKSAQIKMRFVSLLWLAATLLLPLSAFAGHARAETAGNYAFVNAYIIETTYQQSSGGPYVTQSFILNTNEANGFQYYNVREADNNPTYCQLYIEPVRTGGTSSGLINSYTPVSVHYELVTQLKVQGRCNTANEGGGIVRTTISNIDTTKSRYVLFKTDSDTITTMSGAYSWVKASSGVVDNFKPATEIYYEDFNSSGRISSSDCPSMIVKWNNTYKFTAPYVKGSDTSVIADSDSDKYYQRMISAATGQPQSTYASCAAEDLFGHINASLAKIDGAHSEEWWSSNLNGTVVGFNDMRKAFVPITNFLGDQEALDHKIENASAGGSAIAGGSSTVSGDDAGTAELQDNCPLGEDVSSLRWLGCGIYGALKGTTDLLVKQLDAFLYTDPAVFSESTQAAAIMFRNIGMALIIMAGLIMVISHSLGFDFLDAYTIRKLLPRLGVALVGMALAWPLLRLAVQLTNDLGGSIYSAFLDLASQVGATGADAGIGSGLTTVIGYLVGATAIAGYAIVIGAIAFLSLFATIVLALLVGVLVLSIRQLVIFMAIILAPLAIAAYVFPGGEKLWKFWKTTLITTLMMYPLIMGFIGAGAAMAFMMPQVPADGGGTRMSLLAIIVYFAPFFMLPFAFKLAGGLMSTIFSLTNDKSKGIFDRMSNYRKNSGKRRWQEYAIGKRGGEKNVIGKMAAYSTAISDPGVGISGLRTRAGRRMARQKLTEAAGDDAIKNNSLQWTADDFALETAAMDDTNDSNKIQRYIDTAAKYGKTRTAAQAQEAMALLESGVGAKIGTQTMQAAAWKARVLSKTGYQAGDEGMRELFDDARKRVAAGKLSSVQAMGIIKQAQRLEFSSISYGAGMEKISELASSGKGPSNDDVDKLFQSAIQFMQPSQLAGARHETVEGISKHLMKRVDKAFASGDSKEIGRAVAEVESMRDAINYYNPENTKIFADGVNAQRAGTTGTTLRDFAEQLRDRSGLAAAGGQYADASVHFYDARKELDRWQAAAAQATGQIPGASGGTPSPGPYTTSDIRLKRDIKKIAQLESGVVLYSFQYKWGSPSYIGVMAQEVIEDYPEAIAVDRHGFLYVNYALLGIKMVPYNVWLKDKNSILLKQGKTHKY